MEEIAAVLSNEIRRRYFYGGSLGEEEKKKRKNVHTMPTQKRVTFTGMSSEAETF